MRPQPKPGAAADPLAAYTLDTLLAGAARLRPQGLALRDADGASLTFAALHGHATRLAARLKQTGLEPGETLLVLGGNRISSLIALMAGVCAGLDVAMLSPGLRADRLAMLANRTRAAVLVCGEPFGGVDLLDKGFMAAALTETVRLVGTLGSGNADAVDFSAGALAGDIAPVLPAPAHLSDILTLTPDGMTRHSQRKLVAGTLDLIARARFRAAQPLLATLGPSTYAGLASGLLAGLLCGASVTLHGIFDAARLLAQLEDMPQAQLVVPAELLPALARAGILQHGPLAGLLAVSRWQTNAGDFAPPASLPNSVPLVDLHAFGEMALLAEARGADGRARALLEPPHDIEVGADVICAVDADNDTADGLRFFGAAVSVPEDVT